MAEASGPAVDRALVERHVARMRTALAAAVVVVILLAVAGFVLPRLSHPVVTPVWATVLAVAAGLWVGFSANRDARLRMERIKRAYAVHAEPMRLLRDHLLAYAAILTRLALMAAAGVVVALWGLGPAHALVLHGLALAMVAMSWPTEAKARLLLKRAEALR